MKVLHIITGLNHGGAEHVLLQLLQSDAQQSTDTAIISLTQLGPIGERIRALGFPVHVIGMQKNIFDVYGFLKLLRLLRRLRPTVVQTWMFHSDLIGGVATRLISNAKVVWGVHLTYRNAGLINPCGRYLATGYAFLARYIPHYIVCCAEATSNDLKELGYPVKKLTTIPNGVSLQVFRPDPFARASVREEFGLPASTKLVGMAGRFTPEKDHRNFILAAQCLHETLPDVHFLLCGTGVDRSNKILMNWIEQAGIADYCHVLGLREDIPRLLASLDVATLSSMSEACPLALQEAMACGVPCVTTDVGDAGLVIGDYGHLVPPRDPVALAMAWLAILRLPEAERNALGRGARTHIGKRYPLEKQNEAYELLYMRLAEMPQQRSLKRQASTSYHQ